MRELTVSELAGVFQAGRADPDLRPVFLLGAGASVPSMPTALVLKTELVRALWDRTGAAGRELPPELLRRLDAPHLTLEVLCSLIRYRAGHDGRGRPRFDPARLWKALVDTCAPNLTSLCIAEVAAAGLLGGVVTSNFDPLVPAALQALGVPYRFLTRKSAAEGLAGLRDGELPLIAFHGTVHEMDPADPAGSPHSPPTSALARGLATPLTRPLRALLTELLRAPRPVLAIGYSGNDHYDVNPLLRERSAEGGLGSWYWLSYGGDAEREFSRLVRAEFSTGIVRADAAALLQRYVRNHLGGGSPALAGGGPRGRGDDWRVALRRTLEEFDLSPDCCGEVVEDLRRNLPGAWVVLEHYYLYSSVYDEDVTLTFGGIDPARPDGPDRAAEVGHLGVLGTDWGALLRAQHVYRQEDRERTDLSNEERVQFDYPRTARILTPLLLALERRAEESGDLRPVDRAVLLVGVAYAEDYLGLIENKRLMGYEALLAEAGADDGHRASWEQARERARRAALERFDACRRRAEEAERILAGTGQRPSRELMDLVQPHVWAMIGRENRARALEPEESVPEFRTCIEYRWEAVRRDRQHGAEEYYLAHISQLGLRASEMMKSLLLCRGRWDPPRRSWSQLSRREREDFTFALENARAARDAFAELDTVHLRFPAYFEVDLLAAAARGRMEEAREAVEACEAMFARATPEIQSKQRSWVEDVRRRFERIAAGAP